MNEMIEKAVVVLKSIVTWLTAFVAILTFFAEDIIDQLPEEAAVQIGGWIATALAILGAAIMVLREVTRVLPEAVGVLPKNDQAWTTREVAALHLPPPPSTPIR